MRLPRLSSVSISSLKGIEIEIETRADVELRVEEEEGKSEEKIANAMDTSVFGSLPEVSPLISLSPSSSSSMLSPSLSSSSVSTHSTSSSSSSSSIPIIGTPLDVSLSPLVEHIFALYAAEYAEIEMLREEEDSAYRRSLELAEEERERERMRERMREKRMRKQRGGLGVWGWLRPASATKVSFFLA